MGSSRSRWPETVAIASRSRRPRRRRTRGWTPRAPWVAANDKVQRLTSPADVARMRRIAMRYRPVKEQPANMRIVGIERVADRDAFVLQARLDSVTTQRSYFDVVTGLLRRELTTTETLL